MRIIGSNYKGGLIVGATVVGIAYCYKRYKSYIHDKAVNYINRLPLKVKPKLVAGQGVISESVRAGSEEVKSIIPKYQLLVGKCEEGHFHVSGSALRIWDTLVMPRHVMVESMDANKIIYIRGKQATESVDATEYVELDTDLVYIPCTQNSLSRIGAATAKLQEEISVHGEFVSITSVTSMGSSGKLSHDYTSFGKVHYTGTTKGGYSGGLYMKGDMVLGIHAWGGGVNGGYSISYVKSLLNSRLGKKPESTSDFLQKIYMNEDLEDRDVYHITASDEVQIRYRGKYHVVDRAAYYKIFGEDSPTKRRRIPESLRNLDYDDSDSTQVATSSGEGLLRLKSGASGGLKTRDQRVSNQSTELIKELASLSHSKLSKLRSMVTDLIEPSAGSSGLLSQQQQN